MPKTNLVLMSNIENVISLPQSTVDTFAIEKQQFEQVVDLTKLFLSKAEKHFSYPFIKKQFDNGFPNFDFVKIKYPLPCMFNEKEKKVIVNTLAWQKKDILNVDPRDIYSTLVYAYICAYYSMKPLPLSESEQILDYMTNIFIKFFAKKYGLLGSYSQEIPKLRFLVNVYVLVSFFNIKQALAYSKASNLSKTTKQNFEVDLDEYDFYDSRQFIKCLSDSGVLYGLSLHEFASLIIKSLGVVHLAMFEDGMRFMATIAASSVHSNSIFSPSLQVFNPILYNRILEIFK